MKRILTLLAPAALLMAGCSLAEPAETLSGNLDAPVFTASYATGDETRTTLDGNQTTILWSAADEISVFDGAKANQEYVAGGAGKSTDFTLKGSTSVAEAQTWYALYPYDAAATFNGTLIQTSLPAEYTLSGPGSFVDGMNVAVASSKTLNLRFRNVLGWIPVAIKGASDVTKLVFKGNDNENVAGTLLVNADDLSSALIDPSLSKTLTLNLARFEESASKTETKYYYIPIVPQSFHYGFSITVTKSDGDYTFSYDKSVTFARGEKRALFIEIPGGGEGQFIDLVNEPLQWVTQTVSPNPDPTCWDEKHRIYPTTHADLAYAEWTWNNGPEEVTYPEGYPVLDVYSRRVRINRGIFDNDALIFNVPVAQIPAGKSLALTFALRGGSRMPKYWTVEACLDGSTWTPMAVTGEKEGSTGISYEGRDGQTYTAPICITKKDSEHPYLATLPVTTALSSQVVQIRVRVLLMMTVSNSLLPGPENNSNSTVALPKFTFGEVNYPGPYISVK